MPTPFRILSVDGRRFLHMTNAELREQLAAHGSGVPKSYGGKEALANLLSDCVDNLGRRCASGCLACDGNDSPRKENQ